MLHENSLSDHLATVCWSQANQLHEAVVYMAIFWPHLIHTSVMGRISTCSVELTQGQVLMSVCIADQIHERKCDAGQQ